MRSRWRCFATSTGRSTRFEADPAVGLILLEGAGERGLCAGGDIRALYESSKVRGDLGKILWREEYILNARIAKFPKPYVAFMDGIVMGGGVGLAAHGSHRVVTDRTKLAMPEVGLGFFPGCRRHVAAVAFAGRDRHLFRADRADHERPRCGLCRFCRCGGAVRQACRPCARRSPKLRAGANAADVKAVIDGFATGETAGPVAALQIAASTVGSRHDRMEDIFAALHRDGSELAQSTLKTLNEKSPRGMVVTLKLLRLARARRRWKSAWCVNIARRSKYSPATIFARACARR